MAQPIKSWLGAATLLAGALGALPAQAGPYSSMVVFGDSLSDTGNVLAVTTTFTPNPFPVYPGAVGRFSNGPVWVETLATGLSLPAGARPSNLLLTSPTAVTALGPLGGQNFAFGGARTGLGGSAGATTGLLGQLAAWNGGGFTTSLSRAADPNALYVVAAGGNDLRDARSANPGATVVDGTSRTTAAGNAAQGVVNTLALLAQAGARHFLISTMADLGRTPEAVTLNQVAASTDVTLKFNSALLSRSAGFDSQFFALTGIDLDIRTVDLFKLANDVFDDAVNNAGGVYGITNVTTPCLAKGAVSGQYFAPDAVATNCGGSASSDDLHPSASIHALLGTAALRAVPEVPTLPLVAVAMGALALMRRSRAATTR
jgi:outer membrane lipase/esterase